MISSSAKSLLNKFLGTGQSTQLGTLLDKTVGVVTDTYDFAVHGGAISTITIGTKQLPAGAVVTRVFHEELSNVTSGGSATVTLNAGATALTGAIAIATFSGVKSEALASSATAIKISAESDITVTIATATITAGSVRFFIEYMISQDT